MLFSNMLLVRTFDALAGTLVAAHVVFDAVLMLSSLPTASRFCGLDSDAGVDMHASDRLGRMDISGGVSN